MNVYVVRDEKSNKFNQPFIADNDEQAIRMFAMVAANDAVQISMFPDHFSLYRICQIIDEDSTVIPEYRECSETQREIIQEPKFICGAESLTEVIEKITQQRAKLKKIHEDALRKAVKETVQKNNKKKKNFFGLEL